MDSNHPLQEKDSLINSCIDGKSDIDARRTIGVLLEVGGDEDFDVDVDVVVNVLILFIFI